MERFIPKCEKKSRFSFKIKYRGLIRLNRTLIKRLVGTAQADKNTETNQPQRLQFSSRSGERRVLVETRTVAETTPAATKP